jgi:hypothetical protein
MRGQGCGLVELVLPNSLINKRIAKLAPIPKRPDPAKQASVKSLPNHPGKRLCGFVPVQRIQFSLERPLLRIFHISCDCRILPDIIPLLVVALAIAKLAIEEVLLPYGLLILTRPVPSSLRTPICDPIFQRSCRKCCRRAKQMQVVRHQDVSADLKSSPFATQREVAVARRYWRARVGDGGQ